MGEMMTVKMDRRLRTIVEAIRFQNLKQAWKLVIGMDQKKPGWKAVEVLKAVILDKWGRTEEADLIIQRLYTDNKNDWQEETLQTLQLFYDERRDWLSLANVYQQLWTQNMTTSLGETCILYYIRAKHYSEAQKVANKLYRCFQKQYMAWWILTLLLQVRYEKADSRILTLAGKLGNKYITENNSVSPSFIRLYIILLEQLKDYEQAKQLLRHYVSISNDVLKKSYMEYLANICYQSGEYQEALQHYEQLIMQQMESYHYWYMWMKCQLWKREKNSALEQYLTWLLEQANELFTRALSSFDDNRENARTLRQKRTLYMTQMEMCREMIIWCDNNTQKQDLVSKQLFEIIQQYLNDMSSLPCCSTDLKEFVALLKPNERIQLWEQYLQPSVTLSNSSKETIFRLVEHFWLLLSFQASSLPRMDTLLDYYIEWAREDLVPFEHQPADGFILLIVNQLLSTRQHSQSPSYLLQAIQVLELGKHHSPYNLEFRLFLAVFYSFLGCFESAVEEWNAMELKHVQLVTLSFLLGPFVQRWYDIPWMRWYHRKLSLFEKEHMEETPQGIFLAIQQQSYETALDIIQFQYKLDHSEAFLASAVYSWHESLFYHHRNAIRTLHGFSSDWLRHVKRAHQSLTGQQWNEQTCLVEDLYILDDQSSWKKSLGIMNAESWLDSDEMRIQRVRLDYINLRLLLSLLLGERRDLPNWTTVFFESAMSSHDNDEFSSLIEYWYLFWQLIIGFCQDDSSQVRLSSLDNLYQQLYSKWHQCIPRSYRIDDNEETVIHSAAVEYFPIEFPKWMYYVHQIALYGILSIAYLVDHRKQHSCTLLDASILDKLITLFRPIQVDKTWISALESHSDWTISIARISTSAYDKYRLSKTYIQKVQQLQQDIEYLSKLYKTI